MAIQMTRQQYEAKYGQKPIASSTGPIKMTRAEYDAKYNKPFTYDVPEVVETRPQKLARYQAESTQLQEEAKKAKSPLGFMANFGKALVSNLAPSEVGLGETIGKISTDPNKYADLNKNLTDQLIQTRKQIKEREAKGMDTTNLKRGYNSTQALIDENNKTIGSYNKEMPTTGQVAGQLGGTALDVLTAGTYGKAKTGIMATGKLAPKSALSTVSKTAISAGLPELSNIAGQKATGLFTAKGLANVGKGAGIGYGFDVSQGLQGARGEDRSGGKAFIPGLGTAIGAGIPAISEGVQTGKNVLRPDKPHIEKAVDDLENKYTEWISGTKPGKKQVNLGAKKTEALNRAGTTGKTPQRILAEGGIVPKTKGVKFDTFAQAEDYRNSISPLKETNRQALQEAGLSSVPTKLEELQAKAIAFARTPENINSGRAAKMEKEIVKEFNILRREYPNGQIPLGLQDDIKSARWDNVFKNKGLVDADVLKKDSEYAIAKAFQKNIEEVAEQAGHKDVAQLNREIGDRLEGAKFLESLDGKVLKGGRVGKYVGTLIGSSLGQSIPGKIIGAVGGNVIADLLIKSSVSSPVRRIILSKLAKNDPQAYQMTIKWLAEQDALRGTRLALPSGKGSTINLPAEKVTSYEAQAGKVFNESFIPKADKTLRLPAGTPNMVEGETVRLPQSAREQSLRLDETKGLPQSKSPNAQQTIPAIKTVESKANIPTSSTIKKDLSNKQGGFIKVGNESEKQLSFNKTGFLEKTKGQFNSIRDVGGYKVRARMYDDNPWQIVADNAELGGGNDFSKLPVIKEFRTREDLWKYIKDNPKTKTSDALMQEAKKYKSAEEFVKAQESKILQHVSDNPNLTKFEKMSEVNKVYDDKLKQFEILDKQRKSLKTFDDIEKFDDKKWLELKNWLSTNDKIKLGERGANAGEGIYLSSKPDFWRGALESEGKSMGDYTYDVLVTNPAKAKEYMQTAGGGQMLPETLIQPNEGIILGKSGGGNITKKLTDIWKKAQGQAGFSAKNPLIIGAGALGVGALGSAQLNKKK